MNGKKIEISSNLIDFSFFLNYYLDHKPTYLFATFASLIMGLKKKYYLFCGLDLSNTYKMQASQVGQVRIPTSSSYNNLIP